MSKPSWDQAPEWASFLAQGQEGDWYWFEEEPVPTDEDWYNFKGGRVVSARYSKEWMESLEGRP